MSASSQAVIRFNSVELGYGKKTVLRGINAEIQKGDFLGIVGPNGSGKTTMLRSILGWVKPRQGAIERSPRIHFGYVPQRNTIDPLYPLTALDIVLMGLYADQRPWRRMASEHYEQAQAALAKVGLAEKSSWLFGQLSGGQQQRVLLARALVGRPDVLILDEPTNGMDIVSESSVMQIVQEVHRGGEMTIILVTHLLHVVAHHAQKIGLIKGDQIEFGETSKLLTAPHLSELYGVPVAVEKIDGKTVVMVR